MESVGLHRPDVKSRDSRALVTRARVPASPSPSTDSTWSPFAKFEKKDLRAYISVSDTVPFSEFSARADVGEAYIPDVGMRTAVSAAPAPACLAQLAHVPRGTYALVTGDVWVSGPLGGQEFSSVLTTEYVLEFQNLAMSGVHPTGSTAPAFPYGDYESLGLRGQRERAFVEGEFPDCGLVPASPPESDGAAFALSPSITARRLVASISQGMAAKDQCPGFFGAGRSRVIAGAHGHALLGDNPGDGTLPFRVSTERWDGSAPSSSRGLIVTDCYVSVNYDCEHVVPFCVTGQAGKPIRVWRTLESSASPIKRMLLHGLDGPANVRFRATRNEAADDRTLGWVYEDALSPVFVPDWSAFASRGRSTAFSRLNANVVDAALGRSGLPLAPELAGGPVYGEAAYDFIAYDSCKNPSARANGAPGFTRFPALVSDDYALRKPRYVTVSDFVGEGEARFVVSWKLDGVRVAVAVDDDGYYSIFSKYSFLGHSSHPPERGNIKLSALHVIAALGGPVLAGAAFGQLLYFEMIPNCSDPLIPAASCGILGRRVMYRAGAGLVGERSEPSYFSLGFRAVLIAVGPTPACLSELTPRLLRENPDWRTAPFKAVEPGGLDRFLRDPDPSAEGFVLHRVAEGVVTSCKVKNPLYAWMTAMSDKSAEDTSSCSILAGFCPVAAWAACSTIVRQLNGDASLQVKGTELMRGRPVGESLRTVFAAPLPAGSDAVPLATCAVVWSWFLVAATNEPAFIRLWAPLAFPEPVAAVATIPDPPPGVVRHGPAFAYFPPHCYASWGAAGDLNVINGAMLRVKIAAKLPVASASSPADWPSQHPPSTRAWDCAGVRMTNNPAASGYMAPREINPHGPMEHRVLINAEGRDYLVQKPWSKDAARLNRVSVFMFPTADMKNGEFIPHWGADGTSLPFSPAVGDVLRTIREVLGAPADSLVVCVAHGNYSAACPHLHASALWGDLTPDDVALNLVGHDHTIAPVSRPLSCTVYGPGDHTPLREAVERHLRMNAGVNVGHTNIDVDGMVARQFALPPFSTPTRDDAVLGGAELAPVGAIRRDPLAKDMVSPQSVLWRAYLTHFFSRSAACVPIPVMGYAPDSRGSSHSRVHCAKVFAAIQADGAAARAFPAHVGLAFAEAVTVSPSVLTTLPRMPNPRLADPGTLYVGDPEVLRDAPFSLSVLGPTPSGVEVLGGYLPEGASSAPVFRNGDRGELAKKPPSPRTFVIKPSSNHLSRLVNLIVKHHRLGRVVFVGLEPVPVTSGVTPSFMGFAYRGHLPHGTGSWYSADGYDYFSDSAAPVAATLTVPVRLASFMHLLKASTPSQRWRPDKEVAYPGWCSPVRSVESPFPGFLTRFADSGASWRLCESFGAQVSGRSYLQAADPRVPLCAALSQAVAMYHYLPGVVQPPRRTARIGPECLMRDMAVPGAARGVLKRVGAAVIQRAEDYLPSVGLAYQDAPAAATRLPALFSGPAVLLYLNDRTISLLYIAPNISGSFPSPLCYAQLDVGSVRAGPVATFVSKPPSMATAAAAADVAQQPALPAVAAVAADVPRAPPAAAPQQADAEAAFVDPGPGVLAFRAGAPSGHRVGTKMFGALTAGVRVRLGTAILADGRAIRYLPDPLTGGYFVVV